MSIPKTVPAFWFDKWLAQVFGEENYNFLKETIYMFIVAAESTGMDGQTKKKAVVEAIHKFLDAHKITNGIPDFLLNFLLSYVIDFIVKWLNDNGVFTHVAA